MEWPPFCCFCALKKRLLKSLLVSLIAACALGCGKTPSSPPTDQPWWWGKNFVIRGHVYDDSTLNSIEGALVTLRATNGLPLSGAYDTTDQRGYFHYHRSLETITGDVLAEHSLYFSDSLTFQFREGVDTIITLEFYLKRK